MARGKNKKLYRFQLDMSDPVEKEIARLLDSLTKRNRSGLYIRSVLAKELGLQYEFSYNPVPRAG